LSAYQFSVEYRPGTKHSNADALSRCQNPRDCTCAETDLLEPLKCGPCRTCQKRAIDMQSAGLSGSPSVKRVQNSRQAGVLETIQVMIDGAKAAVS
jgi:hypothetical protein